MHKRIVANIISRVVVFVCFVMLIPAALALCDNSMQEVIGFASTISIGLTVSMLTIIFCRITKDDINRINAKDGLAIVGLSWICLSALGALPLFIGGITETYTDAFFEITSGFTTTGASIFTDVEILPKGILFWRSLTHWLGGMGIIVLYIALLPALGINAFQLYKAEAPGLTVERVEPRIKETAKYLWGVYFLFTFVETILLKLGGMSWFDALCHTFGTVATGGFSTKNASIGAFGPYVQWVVIVFMFLAGVNFVLHYLILRGRPRGIYFNEEFRVYAILTVLATGLFAGVLYSANISEAPIRDAAFQVTSILTTTGYSTADFDLWPYILKFSLVMLMFIGGCGGSTGGGMKVMRVLLSAKIALRSGIQSVYPNVIMPIKYNSKPLPERLIMAVLSYFVIFIFLFLLGTFLFTVTEATDLVTAFTASIAALSNIGPGLAKVGATQNYAWVSLPGKWILTGLMLAGRLELYAILILFIPTTWRK